MVTLEVLDRIIIIRYQGLWLEISYWGLFFERKLFFLRIMVYMLGLDDKTDNKLVALALEDRDVFAILMKRYEDKLMRFVKRISNVPLEEVEDLLQEIFIKVYINLRDFDQGLSFSSWIYRIARNHTISSFRKHKARPQTVSFDADDYIINSIRDEFDIHIELDKKERKEVLVEAIFELGDKYRDIVVLKFLEEKSYEEIGDILKIPPGTIATRISRAKKHIHKYLKKKGVEI